MEITPAEVQSKQFDQVKRGFDPQQVGAFLDLVAGVLARRDQKLVEAHAEIERLRNVDSSVPSENQEAFRLALDAAAQAKADLLETAAAEADRIQSEARAAAEIIVKQAAALLDGGVSGPLAATAEAAISAMNDTIEASAPKPDTADGKEVVPIDVTHRASESSPGGASNEPRESDDLEEPVGAEAEDQSAPEMHAQSDPEPVAARPARNWLTPGSQASVDTHDVEDARKEGAAPTVSRPPLELVVEEEPEEQPDDSESSLAARVGDLRG